MASNPRIPPHKEHPNIQLQKQPAVPWTLVALVIAAVLLVVILVFVPHHVPNARPAPVGAEAPAQPTGSQVQFTNMKITPAPVGNAAYIEGLLRNQGDTTINGVIVDVSVKDAGGKNLATLRSPVLAVPENSGATTKDLTSSPIKPNQSEPVRIDLSNVPQGWNHQMPALTVVTVTAEGTPPK